jgi:hypothetical protein
MSDWTPEGIKEHGWTKTRAMHLVRILDPNSPPEKYRRVSFDPSKANQTKLNKSAVAKLFQEKKIPLEYDEFVDRRLEITGDKSGTHTPKNSINKPRRQ